MKRVTVIDHPLAQQCLATLRDKRTGPDAFRRALGEISVLLFLESTRSLPTRPVRVTTPLAEARARILSRPILLVPILRAGLGMLYPILQLVPDAGVGFIGVKRHEQTLEAHTYHQSLPDDLAHVEVLLLDPMLATGGSAVAALELLRQRRARHVRVVNLIAAPAGIGHVCRQHPLVPVFTAAIDRKLDKNGFIFPGLGDAGDRLFGP